MSNQAPSNLEAERTVLSAMIQNPNVIPSMLKIINSSEAFFKTTHKKIFEAIRKMYLANESIDVICVSFEIPNENINDIILDYIPNIENLETHASIIVETYKRRKAIQSSTEITNIALDRSSDFGNIFSMIKIMHDDLKSTNIKTNKIQDLLPIVFKSIKDHQVNIMAGVKSGFHDIDNMMIMFENGTYTTIGARPGMGKSLLALWLAHNACQENIPTAILSLEMNQKQLISRLLSMMSLIPFQRLRKGNIYDEEWGKLTMASSDLYNFPLSIICEKINKLGDLYSTCLTLKDEGIKYIIIDYIQLISGSRRESRNVELTEISNTLKALAIECDIPFIILSQLNRALGSRANKRPELTDLRESGSIEQDSDNVLFLHRDNYYNDSVAGETPMDDNSLEVIIKKQRQGPTGEVKLYCDYSKMWLASMERKYANDR